MNSPIALEWLRTTVNTTQEKAKASEMFSKMSDEVKASFLGKNTQLNFRPLSLLKLVALHLILNLRHLMEKNFH
ncbi:hypothetical protein [Pedobacter sp. P26]|uniref:hypothetical protein n=1 Tax=Pedobacter sp. P26 TaxID=3423956 RepID=UPI003D67E154